MSTIEVNNSLVNRSVEEHWIRPDDGFVTYNAAENAGWGELLDVRVCGCQSRCCWRCSGVRARRDAIQLREDCQRLGVKRLSTLCITVDPNRFGWDHLMSGRVVHRLMAEFWERCPKHYKRRWGDVPVWWAFKEFHDGKRRSDGRASYWVHVHVYLPARSNKTGKGAGRLPREDLVWLNHRGNELSGRTEWGWPRRGWYSLAVSTIAGYASKGEIGYAAKGVGDVPAEIAESVSFKAFTRSRGVTVGDPVCVAQRNRLTREKHIEYCEREAVERDTEYDRKWFRDLAEHLRNTKRKYRRMRTNSERVRDCGQKVVIMRGREFRGARTESFSYIRRAVLDAVMQSDLAHGGELADLAEACVFDHVGMIRAPASLIRAAVDWSCGVESGSSPSSVLSGGVQTHGSGVKSKIGRLPRAERLRLRAKAESGSDDFLFAQCRGIEVTPGSASVFAESTDEGVTSDCRGIVEASSRPVPAEPAPAASLVRNKSFVEGSDGRAPP